MTWLAGNDRQHCHVSLPNSEQTVAQSSAFLGLSALTMGRKGRMLYFKRSFAQKTFSKLAKYPK